MRLVSNDLGQLLRTAFEAHGASQLKRCVWVGGLWYVEI